MPIVTEKQPTPERSENDANENTNTSKGTSCPFHVATPPSPDMSSDKTHSHVGYENGTLGQNGNEDLAHNGDDHSQVESSLESSPHSSPVQNGNESVPFPPREEVKVSSKEKKQYKLFQSPKEKKELQDDYEAICLKILLPGQSESIDVIQIAKDTVNDLLQYSFEKPECCYRTCLSLRFNGKKLDNFAELGSIKDLKNGSTIEIVEEPYTLRDVMIHIERLQELLSPHSLQLSLSCINGLSLSFLSIVVQNTLENPSDSKKPDNPFPLPPDHILPSSSASLPLASFYPQGLDDSLQTLECLKSLSYSVWNPPPSYRRHKGDLLYLDVKTLEGECYCITAGPGGFYLNKSVTDVSFDPSPRKVAHHCQHLLTLLQQISPLFRKSYSSMQKLGEKKNIYEILPVPYPVHPWIVPKFDQKPATFRIDNFMGLKAQIDELLVGQLRDWNEDLQTMRELPVNNVHSRIFKDRALFKIHSDFVQAAIRGAKAAVDGQLPPLNPTDPEKNHMFMWNNMFFSTGSDGRGHFKDFGGDEAGHAAANYDLLGVEVIEALNIKGLHTLGAVLVDYRGYRVFAQSIVPGLLQREHESSIAYGTMDNGKTFNSNEKFQQLLKECGEKLHHRPHRVMVGNNEEVTLPVSMEIKGIEGTDGRSYVLDLFRILPPDVNYSEASVIDDHSTATSSASTLRHKLFILRPELVDGFLRMNQRIALELQMFKEMKSLAASQKSHVTEKPDKDQPIECNGSGGVVNDQGSFPIVLLENGEDKDINDVTDLNRILVFDLDKSTTSQLTGLTDTVTDSTNDIISDITTGTDDIISDITTGTTTPTISDTTGTTTVNDTTGTTTVNDTTGTTTTTISDTTGTTTPTIIDTTGTTTTTISDTTGTTPTVNDTTGTTTVNDTTGTTTTTISDTTGTITTVNDTTGTTPTVNDTTGTTIDDILLDQDFRFNPDILAPGVRLLDSSQQLAEDRKLIVDISNYLTDIVIPKYVRDCVYINASPLDGSSLKSHLHSRGINLRYIGKIASIAESRDDLSHLHRLCLNEMVVRTARRRYRKVLLTVPIHKTSVAIAHILNCLFTDVDEIMNDETSVSKKKTKRKRTNRETNKNAEGSYLGLSQGKLWKMLQEDISSHYRYTVNFSSLTEVCNKYNIPKVALLREFCIKAGIQLVVKEYKFSSLSPFHEDDLVGLVPVVKHTNFKSMEASGLFDVGQVRLQSGNIKGGHEYLMEAVKFFTQVYGPLHVDIANCYRVLARVQHALGDTSMAIQYQYKSVLIYERLFGIDHSSTITAYFHLAQYCCIAGKNDTSALLLYHTRYLILLIHGTDHPELANVDFYIGLILSNSGHFTKGVEFLESALKLQKKFHGESSITVATTHHLIATSLTSLGSFSFAKQHERKAYTIFRTKLGPEHSRTIESYKEIRHITEKHVSYEQTIELAQGLPNNRVRTKVW